MTSITISNNYIKNFNENIPKNIDTVYFTGNWSNNICNDKIPEGPES